MTAAMLNVWAVKKFTPVGAFTFTNPLYIYLHGALFRFRVAL